MYKTVCGLRSALASVDDITDDMMLEIKTIINIIINAADPKNDAQNVLKKDFISIILSLFY